MTLTKSGQTCIIFERTVPERDCPDGELDFAQELILDLLFHGSTPKYRERAAARIQQGPLLVAYRDHAVAGVASFRHGQSIHPDFPTHTMLDYIGVTTTTHQGVGSMLVGRLAELAVVAGDAEIHLVQSQTSAGFYDRLGFGKYPGGLMRNLVLGQTQPSAPSQAMV